MTHFTVSANFCTSFEKAKNVFAADANMPHSLPHTPRIYRRKYCRIPAFNRKPAEPRNFPP